MVLKQVHYNNVVASVEDKGTIKAIPSLNTGRGQLVKLALSVLKVQRQRPGILGILMSCQDLELWWFRHDLSAVTSDVLPLSLSPTSSGLRLLFQVLSASPYQLGYRPPLIPPCFERDGVQFGDFQRLTPWEGASSSQQSASREPVGLEAERRAARPVFSAKAAREGQPLQDVILKFYPRAAEEVRTVAAMCTRVQP